MLMKIKREESNGTPVCGKKTFKFLAKMTRSKKSSAYKRFDSDVKESKKIKKQDERKTEEFSKGKENKMLAGKEVKEKKSKKKGWKRVRQAAFASCRYIGMGAALMSPATVYPSPDYSVDPKHWDRSFSSSYKSKVPLQTPHWTSNFMYAGW